MNRKPVSKAISLVARCLNPGAVDGVVTEAFRELGGEQGRYPCLPQVARQDRCEFDASALRDRRRR